MAGSALVILADGYIAENERNKMMAFIQSNSHLSVYDPAEVLSVWKEYLQAIERDRDVGKAKALSAIGKLNGKTEQARLVMRMIIAIGMADGDFEAEEKRTATMIAQELGLSAADFDIK